MEKWAQHRTTDMADDNVAYWGCYAIYYLARGDTRAPWLAAGAEGVLRGIIADTSGASVMDKHVAICALIALDLQA